MNVYCVLKNADQTEGRGPMILDSVWDNMDKARRYAEQKYGSAWSEIRTEAVRTEDLDVVFENQLQQQALNKLTSQELKALANYFMKLGNREGHYLR